MSPVNTRLRFRPRFVSDIGYRNSSLVLYPTPALPAATVTLYVDASIGDDSRTFSEAQNPSTPWKTTNKINAEAQPFYRFICTGRFDPANGSGALTFAVADVQIVGSAPGAATLAGAGVLPAVWFIPGMKRCWIQDMIVEGPWNDGLEAILWQITAEADSNRFVRVRFHNGLPHIYRSADNWFYDCENSGVIGSHALNNGDGFFVQDGAHRTRFIRWKGRATCWHSAGTISYQGGDTELTVDDMIIAGLDVINPGAGGILLNGLAVRAILEDFYIHDVGAGQLSASIGSRLGLEINGTDCVARFGKIHNAYRQGLSVQSRLFNSLLAPALRNHLHNITVTGCGSEPAQIVNRGQGDARDNILENLEFWDNHKLGPVENTAGYLEGQYFPIWAEQFNADIGGPGVWSPTDAHGNICRHIHSDRPASVGAADPYLVVVRNASNGGNLKHTIAQAQSAYAGWVGSFSGVDPLLIDPPSGDVRFQAGSPLKDAGILVSGANFNDAAMDVGAWEGAGVSDPGVSTNEPANFELVTEREFAAKEENGWLDRGDAEFSIQEVGGPQGDGNVGQALFPSGFPGNGSGPISTYYATSGDKSKLFLRIVGFRVDTGWYGHDGASINKIFFIWHGSGPGIFLQIKGSGSGPLFFRLNTQMPSAVQTRDYEFGQASQGGVDFECVRGRFYDVEILAEENPIGSEDTGRLRMWVKEHGTQPWTLVADSNVEVPTYDGGAFTGVVFWDVGQTRFFNGEQRWNPTYGGAGGSNVPDDQFQQIDYIRISQPT